MTNDGPTMTMPAGARPRIKDGGGELLRWLGKMRDEQPVWRDSYGIFHVFRHADIQRVMSDYATFSSDINRLRPGGDPFSAGSLMLTDPPEHRKLRKLISQAFTPKMSSDMVPRIRELTLQLLDEIDGDEFDLVEKIAHPLPVMVIAELLGIPIHDRELFRGWADRLVALHVDDPTDIEIGRMVGEAMREMGEYVMTHVRERRVSPRDDLVSQLVAAEVDGDRLTDAEIVNSACLLLLAGQITSTMALGNAFLCFRDEPGVERAVREDPELLGPAFEEVLRLRPPLTQAARLPTAEVEVAGVTLPAGSMVINWLLSANYDERQFPDPYTLDLTRQPNRQYAFGHGIHFCLGAPLARVEGKVALELIFDRFAEVTVDPDAKLEFYEDPMFGVKSLPVRVR
ncbi:cytochrome P450 [Nonomuraea sediminis]|uniref:cytochrome P450 n=1 Tax=Nonomuraea sediminis TaxID=2835864 RepID=UPI001BDC5CCE